MTARRGKLGRRADIERRLGHRAARDPLVRDIRLQAGRCHVDVWLVGGYVRDAALGCAAVDLDFAAGRGTGRLVRALQSTWKKRGFCFRKRGVTTWRFRVAGREVDIVDAARRGIESDLLRREFTLNAVAFDLATSRLLDPLGGLRDLRAGRLRLPRPGVIREDPVRALRAARFLAQFPDFRLDGDARRESTAAARALRRASIERVRDELNRLLDGPAPERGLEALETMRLLKAVLPELLPMLDCTAGKDRPDVWRHTLAALVGSVRGRSLPGIGAVRDPDRRLVLRWAILLHDMAKPETLAHDESGRPTFHKHEPLGARRADALMRRLRQPRWLRQRVRRLVLFHLRPHHLADAGAPARGMRRLVREADNDLPALLFLAACDARASGAPDARARWRRLRPVLKELAGMHERRSHLPMPRLVSGEDVMETLEIPAGPTVGSALRAVREKQESGGLRTRDEALAFVLQWSRRGAGARRAKREGSE